MLFQRQRLQKWVTSKEQLEQRIPVPKQKVRRFFYRVCTNTLFEVLLYLLIFANIVTIIYELVEESRLCPQEFEDQYGQNFAITNYTFIAFYTTEAVFKVTITAVFSLIGFLAFHE